MILVNFYSNKKVHLLPVTSASGEKAISDLIGKKMQNSGMEILSIKNSIKLKSENNKKKSVK